MKMAAEQHRMINISYSDLACSPPCAAFLLCSSEDPWERHSCTSGALLFSSHGYFYPFSCRRASAEHGGLAQKRRLAGWLWLSSWVPRQRMGALPFLLPLLPGHVGSEGGSRQLLGTTGGTSPTSFCTFNTIKMQPRPKSWVDSHTTRAKKDNFACDSAWCYNQNTPVTITGINKNDHLAFLFSTK